MLQQAAPDRLQVAALAALEELERAQDDVGRGVVQNERRDQVQAPIAVEQIECGDHLRVVVRSQRGDQRLEGLQIEVRSRRVARGAERAKLLAETIDVLRLQANVAEEPEG